MVFILRFLICLITFCPRIVRIELVIWKKLNKMQFRYWGANNCGYKCKLSMSAHLHANASQAWAPIDKHSSPWLPLFSWHFLEDFATPATILSLLLKKVGSARLGESDQHPVSLKTPAPQHKPMEWKKRKGKQLKTKRDQAARRLKMHWPCSWNPPVKHHQIRSNQDRCVLLRGGA